MMRAAVYARVSTLNNGQSPEMQLRDFKDYIERRGWSVPGHMLISASAVRKTLARSLTA